MNTQKTKNPLDLGVKWHYLPVQFIKEFRQPQVTIVFAPGSEIRQRLFQLLAGRAVKDMRLAFAILPPAKLEAHKIEITAQIDPAVALWFDNLLKPQIQYIMQVDIGKHR